MRKEKVTYCKDLLSKLLFLTVLFCSVFTFTMYAGTSSLVLQKTTTELFSAENQVTPKRIISYKYALRKIDSNGPVVCFIPDYICQSEVHNLLDKAKFDAALKCWVSSKPMLCFMHNRNIFQILDDEVFCNVGINILLTGSTVF